MKSWLSLAALLPVLAIASPQVDNTYWNSNWNAMYFQQTGEQVSAEYIWDDGVLMGTFTGDTLKGWWREYNNAQTCGPEGQWSGPLLFVFDADGKGFHGSWDYCGKDPATLDPNGQGWLATRRDSGYTESECQSAGRNWCTNVCQIPACGVTVDVQACLESGRFWCSGDCSLAPCTTAIRPFVRAARPGQSRAIPEGMSFDLRGRCLDPSAHTAGYSWQR